MCDMQWINRILLEMWPFYDLAVCGMVKVRGLQPAIHSSCWVALFWFKTLHAKVLVSLSYSILGNATADLCGSFQSNVL
jgi:hypothetical protein